jgi:hypothetical protein
MGPVSRKSGMDEETIIKLLGDLKHRIFPRPFERLAVAGTGLVGVEIRAVLCVSIVSGLRVDQVPQCATAHEQLRFPGG